MIRSRLLAVAVAVASAAAVGGAVVLTDDPAPTKPQHMSAELARQVKEHPIKPVGDASTPDPGPTSKPLSKHCDATVHYMGGQGKSAGFRVDVEPGRRCRFQGRPTITLFDRAGKPIKTRQSRDRLYTDPEDSGQVVNVRAGHPAAFTVLSEFGTPTGRGCRMAGGITVRLTPGGRSYRAVVRESHPDYRRFSPCGGAIAVTPMGMIDAAR